MKLTNKEKDILNLALTKLDEYYDEREKTCREFKWICHDYLPQAGDGYVANKNVFDIQDKTIEEQFNSGVDRLRFDVDRLELRLKKL